MLQLFMSRTITPILLLILPWILIVMGGCGIIDAFSGPSSVDKPNVTSDGSGGAIVVYQAAEHGDWHAYVQRIGPDGNAMWSGRGSPLYTAQGLSPGSVGVSASIVTDGAGGAILVWRQYSDGTLKAQRVDSEGRFLWKPDGLQLTQGSAIPGVAISDGSGGAIVSWGGRVQLERIDGQGRPLWPTDSPLQEGQGRYLNMAGDKLGGVLLVWDDSKTNVFTQKIGPNGDVLWPPSGVQLVAGKGSGTVHFIVSDGSGGAIVIFGTRQGDQGGGTSGIGTYAQRVDSGGNVLWQGGGVPIPLMPYVQGVVEDGAGGAIVVFREGPLSVYGQRIDGNGNLLWGTYGPMVWDGIGRPAGPIVSTVNDDSGGVIIVLEQEARGSRPYENSELHAQRLGSDGQRLWGDSGALVTWGSRGWVGQPFLSKDGSGGVLIAWVAGSSTHHTASSYVQKIDANGSPRWGKEGLRLDR